jgi:hypothetical protein
MQENNQEKELDLIDLIKLSVNVLVRFFKWLIVKLLQFTKFNIHYWYVVLLFVIIGCGFTVYKFLYEPKMTAEFAINMQGVDHKIVADRITVLGQKINPQSKHQPIFAKELGVDSVLVECIIGLNPYLAVDLNEDGIRDAKKGVTEELDTTISVMKYQLIVEMKSRGHVQFSKVQKAIVDYLNADEDLLARRNKYVEVHLQEIEFAKKEIANLDSLQLIESQRSKVKVDEMGVLNSSANTLAWDKFGLFDKITSIKLSLNTQQTPVVAISDAYITAAPTIVSLAIKYVGFFYVLALFICVLLNYRKNIVEFIREA